MELFSDKFWIIILIIFFIKSYVIEDTEWDIFSWIEFILAISMMILLIGNLSGKWEMIKPFPYLIIVVLMFAMIRKFLKEEDWRNYNTYELLKSIFIKIIIILYVYIFLFHLDVILGFFENLFKFFH